MNSLISRLFFFYPATLLKGEPIPFLLQFYRSFQWENSDFLLNYHLDHLKKMLCYAYNNSEFYRNLYDKEGFDPKSFSTLDQIKKIPEISKYDLINNFHEMSVKNRRLFVSEKTTGGSTGEPVKLFKDSIALARERCATARSYEWAGVRLGDPQLRFWGVPHSHLASARSRITDLIANRKRISAFNLTERSLHEYYKTAVRFKPKYIYGYVSVVEEFAEYFLRHRKPVMPSLTSVITTSEILTDQSRKKIMEAFQVPVFNEYGCGEVGSVAHECPEGNLHVMADNLFLEVDDGGTGSGEGELIVTDLFNKATPMIRYRLGDYGRLSNITCKCGRSLPVIENIHGRAYDIIELPNGQKVHPEAVIYIFENIQSKAKAFLKFQVVQESKDKILINIIPSANWSVETESKLIADLRVNLSDSMIYQIKLVDRIERDQSGKMRLVKGMK